MSLLPDSRLDRPPSLPLAAAALLFGLVAACEKPIVVQGRAPAEVGGMIFEAGDYDVRRLEIHSGKESFEYAVPVMVLPIKVTNADAKAFTYNPAHSAPQMNESATPLVYPDPGGEAELPPAQKTPLRGVTLSQGAFPGQINQPRVLNQGESLTDYYLFELPSQGTSALILSIPPTWHRKKMPALVRFPYAPKQVKGPKVYGLNEPAVFDDKATFTLTGAETAYIKTEDTVQGEGYSTNPLLKLTYTIENTGDQPLEYEPNHRAVAGAVGARLSSQEKGAHKRVQFSPSTSPVGQLRGETELAPGKTLTDYVLFEQPDEQVTTLSLEFPASLFEAKGVARVAFAYDHVVPPRPAELDPKTQNDPKPDAEESEDGK